jgi:ABC-type multidrug transport system ATPase subunit
MGHLSDVLEILGLAKRFGERVALDGLTVAIPAGEVVGLLGPNGSGKTTAVRIVFGVIDPDAGEVR